MVGLGQRVVKEKPLHYAEEYYLFFIVLLSSLVSSRVEHWCGSAAAHIPSVQYTDTGHYSTLRNKEEKNSNNKCNQSR